MRTIPIDYLHELFDVDFEAGTLTWRRRPVEHFKDGKRHSAAHIAAMWSSKHAGTVAGALNGHGYLQVKIDGRLHLVHRVIWAMANGRWPDDQIDHINGKTDDNRLSNLRVVSHAENHRNRTARRGGTSRFPGVARDTTHGKWLARVRIDGKLKHIGYFANEIDAAEAYRAAARAAGYTERHLEPAEQEHHRKQR